MPTIVGLFDTLAEANSAIRRLRSSGFRDDMIGVAMKETEPDVLPRAVGTGDLSTEGATTGAISGAGVGVLVGLALVGSSLILPGIGTILIGGPLAAALAGAGVGAASGGLLGALIGLGIPEAEAAEYATGLQSGGILVSVRANDEHAALARRVLDEEGARRTQETQTP